MKAHIVLLFIFLAIGIAQAAWGSNAKDKVRLDQVSTLTLRRNAYTSGRRSSPVPQLNCVGGAASSRAYEIETVQCENKGSDGYDIQWKCEADMDSNLRFGKVEVTCEGYDYPEDPYILRGSCGLEYTLEYTNQGKQQQQQQNQQHSSSYHYSQQDHHRGGGFGLKTLLMIGVVIFIFYNIYRQCAQMGAQPGAGAGTGQWGPGGPGGPGGGNGYPPGSWGPGGPPPGSGPYGGPYYGGGGSCAPPPPPPTSSWRPGFWTGLAAGGFMGNMFNRPRYGGYGSYGPRYSTPTFSSGPSFSSGGGSSSSSSRTASGFGGTRRR
eukprot:Phypoly_transcript_13364.p1 GENE.Phypoly_transcript_13364~~Phypoly_transcript_13364.p1  ORF type:complete len:337 (+),score=46.94 Phypoly_transcript_13364:51-1013(+)